MFDEVWYGGGAGDRGDGRAAARRRRRRSARPGRARARTSAPCRPVPTGSCWRGGGPRAAGRDRARRRAGGGAARRARRPGRARAARPGGRRPTGQPGGRRAAPRPGRHGRRGATRRPRRARPAPGPRCWCRFPERLGPTAAGGAARTRRRTWCSSLPDPKRCGAGPGLEVTARARTGDVARAGLRAARGAAPRAPSTLGGEPYARTVRRRATRPTSAPRCCHGDRGRSGPSPCSARRTSLMNRSARRGGQRRAGAAAARGEPAAGVVPARRRSRVRPAGQRSLTELLPARLVLGRGAAGGGGAAGRAVAGPPARAGGPRAAARGGPGRGGGRGPGPAVPPGRGTAGTPRRRCATAAPRPGWRRCSGCRSRRSPAAVVDGGRRPHRPARAEVGALLYGPAPVDDADLVALADDARRVEPEVRRS